MSNELMIKDEFVNQLAEFDKIQETCKKLLATKHYQKLGEEGVHVIMARAKALGIHPFEALNGGFFVVQGKVGMSTEMMAALARKRGHSIKKDHKSNNEICILHGTRADNGDTWTCTFSKQDAEAAGLWHSATWKKYPGVMLYNRCMSQLFRQLFPDLSLGAGYVEDELREITKTGEYAVKETIDVMAEPVKPLYIEKKEDEPTIEKITSVQADELHAILDECPLQYQDHFLQKAMPANFKCKNLAELPSMHYAKVKEAFLIKRAENYANQQAEFEAQKAMAKELDE